MAVSLSWDERFSEDLHPSSRKADPHRTHLAPFSASICTERHLLGSSNESQVRALRNRGFWSVGAVQYTRWESASTAAEGSRRKLGDYRSRSLLIRSKRQLKALQWSIGFLKKTWEGRFDDQIRLFIQKITEFAQAEQDIVLSDKVA